MTSLVVVLVVLVLVIVNGLYVASEFALVGVSRALVEADAESGDRTAVRVQSILDDPRQQDRYIAATQLGVTFASLGLGMYGEKNLAGLLIEWFSPLGEAEQGWAGQIQVAGVDQGPHLRKEEGHEQARDVRTVHIRIRHDDDFVIAQIIDVEFGSHADAKRLAKIADFCIGA